MSVSSLSFFLVTILVVLSFLADGGHAASRRRLVSGAAIRNFSNDGVFFPYRGTGAVGRYWNGSPSVFLGTGFSASCEEDAIISVIRMQTNPEKIGSADSPSLSMFLIFRDL